MTKRPPLVDLKQVNQFATIVFYSLIVENRELNRCLSQREIEVRWLFVISLICLGLFKANGKLEENSINIGGSGHL
jgi:hypothetical protein